MHRFICISKRKIFKRHLCVNQIIVRRYSEASQVLVKILNNGILTYSEDIFPVYFILAQTNVYYFISLT